MHIVKTCLAAVILLLSAARADDDTLRKQASKLSREGNHKEAYEAYRKLALDPKSAPDKVADDLAQATMCLNRLGRIGELDAFREAVVEAHAGNWRLLAAAAQNYLSQDHNGAIVAGAFTRGHQRHGRVRWANAWERDRARALQLLEQARQRIDDDANATATDKSTFYEQYANALLSNRGVSAAWRLQTLTDLDTLPDYDDDRHWWHKQTQGAPVHADGTPVYHRLPDTFDTAATDGERWRWLLDAAAKAHPPNRPRLDYQFAGFLHQQFGVQTLRGTPYGPRNDADETDQATGVMALHTLADTETTAHLATGISRFTLPDEFNHIRILKRLADSDLSMNLQSLEMLARIYENRRQFPRAAEAWREAIKRFGKRDHRTQALDRIVGNWGQFEPGKPQPAGRGAIAHYRFRNAERVTLTARHIKVPQLLEDIKKYLEGNPRRLNWQQVNLARIGHRLIQQKEKKYIGDEAARWTLDLDPRPDHFDRITTITTPLQKAGAYLLEAALDDGNTSRIVIWVADTVIVRKPLENGMFYYVADAVTGAPVAKANLAFFGYRQEYIRNKVVRATGRQHTIHTTEFAEFTDNDGQLILKPDQADRRFQWLITATAGDRLAFLGFDSIWYGRHHDREYNQNRTLVVTDRPVYRPDQTVKFKAWVRNAKYDLDDVSNFAHRKFLVTIHNPKNEKLFEKQLESDAYGGFDSELALPDDAALGVYRIVVQNGARGHATFRVEEYKKPEFEVTVDAPAEPVMLGEKITAKVTANYYFGSPVTQAEVKVKVLRYSHSAQWYPSGYWDWLYAPGYWWFACDYPWYPGWTDWGCPRPRPWWIHWSPAPPEVVSEVTAPIGEDGALAVPIDTTLAKEIHGNTDHRYEITAEVVDASRRTIVGTGEVLVARRPFKVYAWLNRGHYDTGDTIRAGFRAQTLDNRPVTGSGTVRLYRITYADAKPVEKEIESWELPPDDRGDAELQLKAGVPGQYRLAYTVTDKAGHAIEGAYVFTVRGRGFDGGDFRFNDIELVPDKKEYRPGDTAELMVNTNRAGGTVLLFLRPSNQVYLPPEVIRLDGKSTVAEIAITRKDMPNFFVEAITIADGALHEDTREIVVPPEKRVLDVEVIPSSERYLPGQQAEVKVKVTDRHGKPHLGALALTVYDKAVEYISGGSNVPEIRNHFWSWRRHHRGNTLSNLTRIFHNLVGPGDTPLQPIGAFGHITQIDGDDDAMAELGAGGGAGHHEYRAKGGARRNAVAMEMAMDASAPSAAAPAGMAFGASDGQMMAQAAPAAARGPGKPADAPPPMAAAAVRTNFADTAYWAAALTTDKDGIATVRFPMPENLTGWKIRTWAMGHGTRVGQGEAEVVTAKNLILRLQAPRFFVEKDEVVLSANVHNYLKDRKRAQVVLEVEGNTLELLGEAFRTVSIAANGETRVDWRVRVTREGEAVVRMKALTDEESDAMEMRFPVYVHGIMKTVSFSGHLPTDKSNGAISIDVPAERRINESRLELRYSPTLAGAMVDALPYLVSYPYGCTEQTLNRFLPTVLTQKILLDMDLDLAAIRDKRTNLNAQEIGEDTERAAQWRKEHKRILDVDAEGKPIWSMNPVFDETKVQAMVKEGVRRLTAMQLSDGGWGWFSGWREQSTPHTTATVVHGLQTAVANDVAIVPGVLDRGIAWLKRYQEEQVQLLEAAASTPRPDRYKERADNLDAFVYMVLSDADILSVAMRDFLYRDRIHLAVYGKAMFGIALQRQRQDDKLAMILRNIEQYLVTDEENQTAYLRLPNTGYWWYWYGSEYEAHAYYLKLLARTDPKGKKAAYLVKYLLNNRKHATYWNSTRDTALCIEAFADFMRASGEDKPDMTLEILVDGRKHKEVRITPENIFSFDNKLLLLGDAVESGKHTIELRRKGAGPLYYNAYLSYFSLEDHIPRAGLEIKVNRNYYRLVPAEKTVKVAGSRGQAVDQNVEKYDRRPLDNLDTLTSGELVEIELVVDSKNDYEYVVFEDMKAAGFEPVDIRSGYTGNAMGAYMEFRDERVAMFVRTLPRGRRSIAYRVRAEIPGRFSALPTKAYAMYAPELKANSDEIKLKIRDK